MSPMIIDFDINEIDSYEPAYLIRVLQAADDAYYNDGKPLMSDAEYDATRTVATKLVPHHKYFTGIGSEIRTGKIKLPMKLGSLDQVEIGEITDWVGNWMLQEQYMIVTDKLDGISALVIYDEDGQFQIAFSRGNGTHGADLSRHIRNIPSVPKTISTNIRAVRGEIIISKTNWPVVQAKTKTKSGERYKNARNCIAGLMNAENIDAEVYPLIDFVAYDILA